MPHHHRALIAFASWLALSSPAAASDTAYKAWFDSIHLEGWTYQSMNDTTMLLTKPGPPGGTGSRRIWARYEFYEPQRSTNGAARSGGYLEEVDCQQQRSRTLQFTEYAAPNLSGATVGGGNIDSSWTYALPGTFQTRLIALACAD